MLNDNFCMLLLQLTEVIYLLIVPVVEEAMKQYCNFKNFYSVVLLGLADANYRFIWASLGAPGNTHDSTYFQSTSLWVDITSGKILPGQVVEINGLEIPPIILGDCAFPLQSWMMKPHGDAGYITKYVNIASIRHGPYF